MSDEEVSARGQRALNELTEVTGAFEAVEAAIVTAMRETPFSQEDKILKLHMALQNLAAVKKALRGVIDNGLMARSALAAADLTRPTY